MSYGVNVPLGHISGESLKSDTIIPAWLCENHSGEISKSFGLTGYYALRVEDIWESYAFHKATLIFILNVLNCLLYLTRL